MSAWQHAEKWFIARASTFVRDAGCLTFGRDAFFLLRRMLAVCGQWCWLYFIFLSSLFLFLCVTSTPTFVRPVTSTPLLPLHRQGNWFARVVEFLRRIWSNMVKHVQLYEEQLRRCGTKGYKRETLGRWIILAFASSQVHPFGWVSAWSKGNKKKRWFIGFESIREIGFYLTYIIFLMHSSE